MQIERVTVDRPWWVVPASVLLEAACGSGYMTDAELRCVAVDPDSAIFVARGPARVLGMSIVGVAHATVRTEINRSLLALRVAENITAEEKVGWFRSVVVNPAVRGQGIGDRCVKAGLEFLDEQLCRTAYAVSWVSGTDQQSEGLLTRNRFTALGVIPNYWSDMVDYRGSCAVCGAPCRCSAIIMRRSARPCP
ncbi:GNAT family N-acetyltransferase [Nocardia nova]|uniref:GNAT family N-acetyltransferase n=1 Tax=Nocardia nova TaxID=37330 RepID=UPI00340AAC45